jgi:hypothetical protein
MDVSSGVQQLCVLGERQKAAGGAGGSGAFVLCCRCQKKAESTQQSLPRSPARTTDVDLSLIISFARMRSLLNVSSV